MGQLRTGDLADASCLPGDGMAGTEYGATSHLRAPYDSENRRVRL